ncbi:glutamine amidotransferase-like class 1 domain-containing protein 1 [Lineus longissimus]|uniref:glutamine amidotransferase-like class 1 domain-containing protein 1 n=1 Tax=Lineus longissimus TaxID=88925 RepID=UPI002B4E018B
MTQPKSNCLIVLSAAIEGVDCQSFIQAFTLTHSTFSVQLASPNGRLSEFINQDDSSRRWLNDFRAKSFSTPINLEMVDANRYSALLLPSMPGSVFDLAHNLELSQIIRHFVKEKKPICAVGMGVAALCCAQHDDSTWAFSSYSLTSTSVFELARQHDFSTIPIIPEDFIKDSGGKYSCSEPDAVHVVIDRHLITGQNEQSTLTAVQNLILLCNQRQGKGVK